MNRFSTALRSWLEHRHLPLHLALLAMILCSPALNIGWLIDDYYHRAALLAPEAIPEVARSPLELFAFVGQRWEMSAATVPWWAEEGLRLAFFRPVSGATHWLDIKLWPGSPALMHLHSLLWLGLTAGAAAWLYRRLAGTAMLPWVAGLAGLLFAVDDGHAVPGAWIANRNALLAAFFSLAALLAFDRWRRDGWLPGAWWAPLLLLAGVLSGEGAVGCGAYLLAYALFLDQGSLKNRLLAITPCAAVGVLWSLSYKLLHYGASNSAIYIDPGTHPWRFLQAAVERAPLLLWGQWSFPPADLYSALSRDVALQFWWLAAAFTVVLTFLLWPLIAKSPLARFFATGMLLSLLPACATFPAMRLMLLPGFGAMGLLALFLARAWTPESSVPTVRRRLIQAFAGIFVVIHLFLSPLATLATPAQLQGFGELFTRSAVTLPKDSAVLQQQVVIVQAPTYFFTGFAPIYQTLQGENIPADLFVLSTGIYDTEIERLDERTLILRPRGGFGMDPGTAPPGEEALPFDPLYLVQLFDTMFRDRGQFLPDQKIELPGVVVEVLEVTAEGRPAAASFQFDRPLEDQFRRWLQWDWKAVGFVPFDLPEIGEERTLPGPFWRFTSHREHSSSTALSEKR